ncbi:hypothetical protein D4764_18G0001060 [Takifugu flavidus]|uniref:Uncharacterized protein n=1 Tax=Takifugu flavidus TaxID=433684 RepID=A0A5C6NT68_9TELE|nr:hypothetical protein D4764_18G0001060 [Takifugu flavidus]
MSKRCSTCEESPRTTPDIIWWWRLWTSNPHAVSCSCCGPLRGKYAALKELLLRKYSQSDAERAYKLLFLPGLGDGSAVDLMDSMLPFLGSDEGGFLFPHIFLRQLPHPVQVALANSPSLAAGDFCGLAEEAGHVLVTARRYLRAERVGGFPAAGTRTH